MSQARPGVLIAIIVFAVFAAYAFLAPATYRTSALVVLDTTGATSLLNLPEPLEAARRLSEAVLDRKTLERLSRERAGSSAPEARAQASAGVRQGLQIDTSDARAFSVAYRDVDAARAQSVCNELAKHAADLAPLVLADHTQQRALDSKRQEQTQAVATFLAEHPQVAAEPQASGDQSPERDPAISALNAEKANLEHHILELESGVGSDDPYVDPALSNVALLRRRLSEINAGLITRRQGLGVKPSQSPLPPEIRAEWKRLLDALSESSASTSAAPVATLLAHVASTAPLPVSPIEPNRRLLLFFGVVFGCGLGTAFWLATRSAQRRRTNSSRAPAMPTPLAGAPVGSAAAGVAPARSASVDTQLHLPPAPQLPSGLGPAVPLSAPSSQSARAPIVPMPQRAISSSPPGPPRAEPGSSAPPLAAEPAPAPDRSKNQASSHPPRRFASTLVLPPMENPSKKDELAQDPLLASAAQAWDQQIRAHQVPGFAVVEPGSERPPPLEATAPAAASTYSVKPAAVTPLAAEVMPGARTRPPNLMKVTQPLGSFLFGNDLLGEQAADKPPAASRAPSSGRAISPAPGSQYSYVSTAPPPTPVPPLAPTTKPPSSAPKPPPVQIQAVLGWTADPNLTPAAQRALCEQLYPHAVEQCFVLAVVAVPESVGYKSRVAAEVALALADSGHPRVLLMEGDLHRPWVQRVIGVDMPIATGFSQQLNGRAHNGADQRWAVLGCTQSLHVLAEGMMRSPGLLLSRQFAECLRELRSYYDFIVIDGPSASLEVESGAIDAVIDGLVTVCPARGSNALGRMNSLFSDKRFSAFAPSP